jgi:bifunctional non-homologous end joining protein LigD
VTQVVPGDVPTLVYLANQACITPHPWLSRADRLDHPDQLIIDLDPSTTDFTPVRAGAWALRSLFIELGLTPFVKTTGSRGLHVVVPLDRSADFEAARAFARGVAEVLCESDPEVFTLEWRKDNRHGRVYVDIGRNAYAQTAVAPYAVRPLPHAPVAAPVRWEELDDTGFHPRLHTLRSVPARVADAGDPWAGMGRRARSLRDPILRLERMREHARG